MQRTGLAAIERAKADLRWQNAYAGADSIEVPERSSWCIFGRAQGGGDV